MWDFLAGILGFITSHKQDIFTFLKHKVILKGILGAFGGWANVFIQQYKITKKVDIRFYFENIFTILQFSLIGAVLSILLASNPYVAFIIGYASIPILDKFGDGQAISLLIKAITNYVPEKAERESDKKISDLEDKINSILASNQNTEEN